MDDPRTVVILGAAGRDFHNFNVCFRNNPRYRVVAFTAAQIPGIAGRAYPAVLCGAAYPAGVPVFPESELARILRGHAVDDVVFGYSDVTHLHVMHLASIALANGASFHLLGPKDTMLQAPCPVIAVVAARTGAGKSSVTRYIYSALKRAGRRPVVVRHPMPYGRFDRGVERYATAGDIAGAGLTIEEMEEYQPHVDNGAVVFAGVDYAAILEHAAAAGDIILWDGGNNDMPFYRPDVTIALIDPLRPAEEDGYFPGEVNLRAADVIVIAKANAAGPAQIAAAEAAARKLNSAASILRMEFVATVDHVELIAGRKVLAVEDGPSVTHGGLAEAGAARTARAHGATLVDPRPYAVGTIAAAYAQYPHMGCVLPALGYSDEQRDDLRRTIAGVPCEAVLLGTPANLAQLMQIDRPVARVSMEPQDVSAPELADVVLEKLRGIESARVAPVQ